MRLAASQPKPNGRGTQTHSDALRQRTRIPLNFVVGLAMPVPNTTCSIPLDGELVFIDLLIDLRTPVQLISPITIDLHRQIQFKSLPLPDYPYAKYSYRLSCLFGPPIDEGSCLLWNYALKVKDQEVVVFFIT